MDISYVYNNDLIYKKEKFFYRFQGYETADVEIIQMIQPTNENNDYAFHIWFKDDSIPEEYRSLSSEERVPFQSLNPDMEIKTIYKTKDECIQSVINWISFIMRYHSNKDLVSE